MDDPVFSSLEFERVDLDEHQLSLFLFPESTLDGGAPSLVSNAEPRHCTLKIEVSISSDASATVRISGPVDITERVIEGIYSFLVLDAGVVRVSLYKSVE